MTPAREISYSHVAASIAAEPFAPVTRIALRHASPGFLHYMVRAVRLKSPDGAWIGFTAYDNGKAPRGSACSGLVNSEIFLIIADGSTTATPLTDTKGTSVEAWPKWGW